MQNTLARDAGIRGAFVFPVMWEGKAIGVLAFSSREGREPEDRLLQSVARSSATKSASSCRVWPQQETYCPSQSHLLPS